MSVRRTNTRSRSWCFTLNNPARNPPDFAKTLKNAKHFRYLVFQTESGARATPHYQGYIEFNAPMRFAAMKKLIGTTAHLETRRGTRDEARDYCMKEDSRTAGPWEYGDWTLGGQGKRNDLNVVAQMIKDGSSVKDVALVLPHMYIRYHKGIEKLHQLIQPERSEAPRIILIYGPTGTGKTRTVMEMKDVFKKSGTNKWFDGYEGQKTLLIDDFGGRLSKIPLTDLLMILDRYPLQVEVKGAYRNLLATEIYVTTNIHPRLWYDWSSRETQYLALKRRFAEVWWFKKLNDEVKLQPDSFWDDWVELCNEEALFKAEDPEMSFDEASEDSDEVTTVPDTVPDTQPTQIEESIADTQDFQNVVCVDCECIVDETGCECETTNSSSDY